MDKCAASWDRAKEAEVAAILTEIKEEAKSIAKSRRDMIAPKPMEADKVRTEQAEETEEYDCEGENFTEEEGEVCYVGKESKWTRKGKGACFAYGAMCHRAAECPNKG